MFFNHKNNSVDRQNEKKYCELKYINYESCFVLHPLVLLMMIAYGLLL